MENIEVTTSVTNRGKTNLIINNYKYCFKKYISTGEKCWRCRTLKCTAFVYTIEPEFTVVKSNLEHNHPPLKDAELEKTQIRVAAKRKATEEISAVPNKILRKVLSENTYTHLKEEDLMNIKKAVYRSRRKLLPPLPKSQEEVFEVLNKMTPILTNRGENFLLHNSSESKIIMFSCETNLIALSNSELIFMNSTFDHAPKHFKQMFTIHGFLNGRYTPLVFVLLDNKSKEAYTECFNILQSLCTDVNFNKKTFVIDFEVAIHSSINSVWPESCIIGCRFHISQAWFREIQRVGLVEDYKRRTEVGKWLGYCFGLLFLDCDEVGDCFVFDLIPIQPESEKVKVFADYLVDTYIAEDSTFPPYLWASKTACSTRTTNNVESFQSSYNKYFNFNHPNIYAFLDFLKEFQSEMYIKINGTDKPKNPNRTTTTHRRMEYLQKLIDDYNNKIISRLHFVKYTSHYFEFFVNNKL